MTRLTQLRAGFELGTDHMRAIWVVTSPAQLDELVADAEPELTDVLVDHRAEATAPAEWVELGGGGQGTWLRADVPVRHH